MNKPLDEDLLNPTRKRKPLLSAFLLIPYAIVLLIGYAFRIMHWPGGYMIVAAGFGLITAYFFTALLRKPTSRQRLLLIAAIAVLLLLTVTQLPGTAFLPFYIAGFAVAGVVGFLFRPAD